jgi:carbonic anhydrase
LTLDNLMTFPCVRILVDRGKLKLHAAYFGVASGDLSIYEPESRTFVRVADAHAKMLAQPRF